LDSKGNQIQYSKPETNFHSVHFLLLRHVMFQSEGVFFTKYHYGDNITED